MMVIDEIKSRITAIDNMNWWKIDDYQAIIGMDCQLGMIFTSLP